MRDLEAVVDAPGCERFALFGHSQGGAIGDRVRRAPSAARQRISCCSALMRAAGSSAVAGEPHGRARGAAQAGRDRLGPRDDASYRQHVRQPVHAGRDARAAALAERAAARVGDPARRGALLRAMWEHRCVRTRSAHVRSPDAGAARARRPARARSRRGALDRQRRSRARASCRSNRTTTSFWSTSPPSRSSSMSCNAFVPGAPGAQHERFPTLTAREAQILEHIAQGLDNAQIAARLDLSEKTVRNHITSIFDKIGVESRAQAIVLAREQRSGTAVLAFQASPGARRDQCPTRRSRPSRHDRALTEGHFHGRTRIPVRRGQLRHLSRRLPVRRRLSSATCRVPKTIDSGAPAGLMESIWSSTCCCSACSPCSTA